MIANQGPVVDFRSAIRGQQPGDQFRSGCGGECLVATDRRCRTAIQQQVGQPRRITGRLLLELVEVVDEIEGFSFDVFRAGLSW